MKCMHNSDVFQDFDNLQKCARQIHLTTISEMKAYLLKMKIKGAFNVFKEEWIICGACLLIKKSPRGQTEIELSLFIQCFVLLLDMKAKVTFCADLNQHVLNIASKQQCNQTASSRETPIVK